MKGELWQRAKQIFLAAADQPLEKRKSFLNAACGDDDGLRAGVDALLESEQQADQFLFTKDEEGVTASLKAATGSDRLAEGTGTRIGPYKLLQRIGEGGFGSVWMAEQTEPVVRKVALKVIKLGMDTKQTLARFEAERQALAMMDHPNIAKVLDAGATDSGRPYFVMELVKGVSITDYCDTEWLRTRDRLDLFIRVCNAVQHAHQKGIIHRDIKPTNVMITLHDGQPVPKVIDFGIAKATSARLTEKTLFTEYGQLIGTPAYMSPEQAELSGLDIDTRSDIYSLGVLLYELLTGLTPFDAAKLRDAGYEEMRRIIREEEPPKPSTRLSSLRSEPPARARGSSPDSQGPLAGARGSEASSSAAGGNSSVIDIARFRRTDPASLTRTLRGDLDWIVMKCLEKDRTRRYETANGVALEIQRHLNNEPVLAGPPSAGYRVAKFVRRNRLRVAAAGGIAAVLIAATAVSIGFALSEAEQRRIADAQAARADQEKADAEKQKAVAEAVNLFLTKDLLAAVAPSSESGKGKDVLMRDVLDEAAERIAKESREGGRFEELPLVEASIRATLGVTYRLLGEYAAGEPHLVRAGQLRRRELGEEHSSTLESMNDLAVLYWRQFRYDEAELLYVKMLKTAKRVLGEEHPSTLSSMGNLALLYRDQSRYGEAELLNVKTLEIMKRVLGEEHSNTLNSMNNLANVYFSQGRYAEAQPLYVKTLEIRKRVLPAGHPKRLNSMNNLAGLYLRQGRHDEAEPLYLETLEIRKRVLGEEHPRTLASMHNLAFLYMDQGVYDDAALLYVDTLEIMTRVLGEDHPQTLLSMNNLALVYNDLGRYDEAEPLYLRTLEIQKSVLGEEDPATLGTITNLGVFYNARKRYDDARAMFETSLPAKRKVLGLKHPWTGYAMHGLAQAYAGLGRREDALPLYREVLDLQLAAADDPDADANTLNRAAWRLLTHDLEELHDPGRALSYSQRACAMTDNANPGFLYTLALAQHLTDDTPAAIETEERALSLLAPDAPGRSGHEAARARFEAALKKAGTAEDPGGG